jgi:transcriptional regulator, AraC family
MRREGYNEVKQRGRFDFPVEFYHVDYRHPRFNMPHHWHIEYEIIRIQKGVFHINLNETGIHAKTGDIIFIRDGIVHGGHPESDACVYDCVVFNMHQLLKNMNSEDVSSLLTHDIHINNVFTADHPEVQQAVKVLLQTLRRQKKGHEFIVTGMLYAFLGIVLEKGLYHHANTEMLDSNRRSIQQLKEAFLLIDKAYATPLTLKDLADAVGLSPNYFCKFFLKMTHRSPIDYLNYYRIETACIRLSTTDASITDIAYSCGFNDLSYFIKTFKKYKATSPRKFRMETNMKVSHVNAHPPSAEPPAERRPADK